jgi:hypothetical protein
MDVLIIPEARREIEAMGVFKPRPGAWGVLIGHKRGPRFIVEKIFPLGNPGAAPDERLLEGLEHVWPGGTIGLVAVRPSPMLKKAALGPAWFGKLVLQITGTAKAPVLRSSVVGFEGKFRLVPVPLAPAAKEKAHE